MEGLDAVRSFAAWAMPDSSWFGASRYGFLLSGFLPFVIMESHRIEESIIKKEKDHSTSLRFDKTLASKKSGFWILLQLYLKLYLPIVLVMSLVVYAILDLDRSNRQRLRNDAMHKAVEMVVSHIELKFANIIDDLFFLADSENVRRFASGEAQNRLEMAKFFKLFAETHKIFDQVLYLDADGNERVRINYSAGTAEIVPESELQNKRGRYYFEDTFRLPPSEVYASPLDLNIERGKIERPLKPMIRFGVPVIGMDGNKRGILLLNYLAADLLTEFDAVIIDGQGELNLLNRDGYWLASENEWDEWGFMFPERRDVTFGRRFPEAWNAIRHNMEGLLEVNQDQFIYSSVFPLLPDLISSSVSGTADASSKQRVGYDEYYWKVVAHYPHEELFGSTYSFAVLFIFLLGLIGIGIGAWLHTKSLLYRRQSLEHLQQGKMEMERCIEDRTQALNESKIQLELLLKSTGEGLCGVDREGICTFCNSASVQLLGFRDESELIGKNLHHLIHHSQADGTPYSEEHCPMYQSFREGRAAYVEDEVLWRKDGKPLMAEYRSHPIWRDGEIQGSVVTFADVRDRRLAEKRLKESEERLRLSLYASQQGLYDMDLRTGKAIVNQHYAEMLGYQPEVFLETHSDWLARMHPEDRESTVQAYQDYIDGKVSEFCVEFRQKTQLGEWKWIFSTGKVVDFDAEGQPRRMIGTHTDITSRKRAEIEMERLLHERGERIKELRCMFDVTDAIHQGDTLDDILQSAVRILPRGCQYPAETKVRIQFDTKEYAVDSFEPAEWTMSADLIANGNHRGCVEAHYTGSLPVHDEGPFVKEERDLMNFVAHSLSKAIEGKQVEEQIRTLSQAVEQSPVSVVITDPEGRIEYVNATVERITGYSAEELIGENPKVFKSGLVEPAFYQGMWQAISSKKSWQGEFQNRKKNRELFWERANVAPVLDAKGEIQHYLAVKEDITDLKRQEEKITYQAHYDNLTELPNRFLCLDRLGQYIREANRSRQQIAVLFLDLDGFKKINDTLGHEVGDKILVQAADRLRDAVRDCDTVGRLGGDEFIVLLTGLKQGADARPVVQNILERFRATFRIDDRELILTASIGIAFYPGDGADTAELLRHADTAMYQSKEEGRNTFNYYSESMNNGVTRRLELEEHLHGALDRGELYLHYQPLIELSTMRVVGAEALLRWRNASLGEVSPGEFIPIAEYTGIIVSIGEFVLEQALDMLSGMPAALRPNFKIAVNLSPRQFRDPNLLIFIGGKLRALDLPPSCLELEITENLLMSGIAYVEEILRSLNYMQIGIAMDDFGTGYSSMNYLRTYPFDTLKIDRSFVQDLNVNPASYELVNATIHMARGLGLKVVAEGVEEQEQLDQLIRLGCDVAQGYLFSRPVPKEQLFEHIEKQQSLADLTK